MTARAVRSRKIIELVTAGYPKTIRRLLPRMLAHPDAEEE